MNARIPNTGTTIQTFQCHWRTATTATRIVLNTMIPVTAMPYAVASALEDLKISTIRATPTPRSAFMLGTYICPRSVAEVWRISMRGNCPSCTACLLIENTPEITACEAMIAAIVASATSG